MIEKVREWLKRHNLVGKRLYVLAATVAVLAALIVATSRPKPPREPVAPATTLTTSGGAPGAKAGRGSSAPETEGAVQFSDIPTKYGITIMQERQDRMDKRFADLTALVEKLAKRQEEQAAVPEGAVNRNEWNNFMLQFNSLKDQVEPVARRFAAGGDETSAEAAKEEDIKIIKVGKDREEPRSDAAPSPGKERLAGSPGSPGWRGTAGSPYYLPPGSMAPGVLLNGVDAPPVAQSGAVTHPVLLLVKAPFTTANNFKVSMEGCLVLGKAEGDLSSERVLIQFLQMACVFPRGRTLDRKVNGYVSGQDGKMGIPGKVHDKRSRKLGQALLVGFTAGLSQAMAQQEVTRVVTAEGTERTFISGNAMTFGLQSGLQSAMAELQNFYREQMSRLFPVVAVPSGTEVTIMVTEGVDIPEINNLYSGTGVDGGMIR